MTLYRLCIIMLAIFAEVLCQNSSSDDTLWWEHTSFLPQSDDLSTPSQWPYCQLSYQNSWVVSCEFLGFQVKMSCQHNTVGLQYTLQQNPSRSQKLEAVHWTVEEYPSRSPNAQPCLSLLESLPLWGVENPHMPTDSLITLIQITPDIKLCCSS